MTLPKNIMEMATQSSTSCKKLEETDSQTVQEEVETQGSCAFSKGQSKAGNTDQRCVIHGVSWISENASCSRRA